ncbi:MAG: Transcription antiterminator, LytR family [Ktedonobacterales bacterium]|nr:MAG: Transcription antiterminator, LytR family [Ktedonobacterales bacterium]
MKDAGNFNDDSTAWGTQARPLGARGVPGPENPTPPPTLPLGHPDAPTLPGRAIRRDAPQPSPSSPLPPLAPMTRPVAPARSPMPMQVAQGARPLAPAVPGAKPVRRKRHIVRYSILATLAALLIVSILGLHRVADFGSAISTQSPFSSQTGYLTGLGRVNLLVMGYGGGNHDGAYLTDSLLVISLNPHDNATTLISVPRDLWVQVPPGSGQYAKINTAYENGYYNGYNGQAAGRVAGGAEAAEKVSEALGMDVSYWLTIDFSGFRELVDTLGGVDITVPTGFTARYPRNDDPKIDPGWKIITFKAGAQHMNGEQAIEYARARYVLQPASEGTDFARSVRQQLLLRAILSRARSVSAWPRLLNAATALEHSLYTNLSLADLTLFSQKLDLNHAGRIGLSNQNVLVDAQSSDGQDILLPTNNDWDAVKQYVSQNLKS